MRTIISITLGILFVARFLFYRVRQWGHKAERKRHRITEQAKAHNTKSWPDITNYNDVRLLRSRYKEHIDAPSYFDYSQSKET